MNTTTNRTTAVIMRTTPPPATDEGGLGFLAIMGIIAACSVVFCSFYFCCCERNCREQSGGAREPRQFKHRRAVISVDIDPAYGNLV